MSYPFMNNFWAFWNSYAPAIPVPDLYWNVRSPEERILYIWKNLGVVIEYVNSCAETLEDLQEQVQNIIDGQLDPIIQQAISDWFNNNQPQIVQDIADLQAADIALDNRIDLIEDAIPFSKSQPGFRCISRVIVGAAGSNGIESGQAGCVFEQGSATYWAQLINSSSTGYDQLIITDIATNTVISQTNFELGHGYTLTYNATQQMLMTQNIDVSPSQIIYIDVSSVANPFIASTVTIPNNLNITNPFWYGEDGLIGAITNTHQIIIFDSSFNVEKTYSTNLFNSFWFGQGFVFQSIQYVESEKRYYIGVTNGDNVIICDELDSSVEISEVVEIRPNYGFIYMRELEFAYRLGDKIYINTFDIVDEQLVVALLEWNTNNGSITAETSPYIQESGNLGLNVDYNNGTLIPIADADGNTDFKLAGDAINYNRLFNPDGRLYLYLKTDYPYSIDTKGTKIHIQAASSVSTYVTIAGMRVQSSDCVIHGTKIKIKPTNELTVVGTIRYACVYIGYSSVIFRSWPDIDNSDGIANPILIYSEYSDIKAPLITAAAPAQNYFRSGILVYKTTAAINAERIDNMAQIQVSSS